MAKFVLGLAITIGTLSLAQRCPGDAFTACAHDFGWCIVPDAIDEGYITYGVDGRWILMPFSNPGSEDLHYECDYRIGDIQRGTPKSCCYTNTNVKTGFTTLSYDYDSVPGGWAGNLKPGNLYFGWPALLSIRYGANDQFVYRPDRYAFFGCDDTHFGNPGLVPGKKCDAGEALIDLSNIEEKDWSVCANEGGMCSGLEASGMQWVRFGDDGSWLYQLIISTDGEIRCDGPVFDDPLPDQPKHCERAPVQHSITGIGGSWENVATCINCKTSLTSTEGITEMEESELTQTWSLEVTATASVDYGFGEASLSATASYGVAHRVMTTDTYHVEKSTTVECEAGYLWQWQTGGESNNGVSNKAFTWKSNFYVCSDSGEAPKCPPLYCADDTKRCHTCRDGWKASGNPPILFPVSEPREIAPQPIGPSPASVPFSVFVMAVVLIALLIVNVLLMCCSKSNAKGHTVAKYEKVYQTESDAL